MPYYTTSYCIIPYISNIHNSVIFHTRNPKFCMVDLDNTNKLYHAIPHYTIPQDTKSYHIPNTSNSHNSLIFQTNYIRPYHTIPQYTKSYQTPNISNNHKSVIFQTKCPKLSKIFFRKSLKKI